MVTGKALFAAAKRHESKLRTRIVSAAKAGRCKRARRAAVEYLRSFDAKLVAAYQANRDLRPHRRVKPAELVSIAEELDPWARSAEEVVVNFKKKSDNNFRPIMDFGIVNKARQLLILEALRAQTYPHPSQYAVATRGTRKASQAVVDALNDGYGWFIEIDVAKCYMSFDEGHVKDLLPLPKKVTDHNVITRNLHLGPGNIKQWLGTGDCEDENNADDFGAFLDFVAPEVRRGIPQGSVASPIVASILLAPVFEGLPGHGRIVNFSDNFAILAKTEGDVVSMAQTLGSAIVAHPAGPLVPKIRQTAAPDQPFSFLGYTFTRAGGGVVLRPTDRNFAKFQEKFSRWLKKLQSANSPASAATRKKAAVRYVKSWAAAFSLWDEVSAFRDQALTKISSAVLTEI